MDCRAFLRTVPGLAYDPLRPEDVDTRQEDHVADEVRYLCMANPMKPARPQQKRPAVYDPLSSGDPPGPYAFYQKY